MLWAIRRNSHLSTQPALKGRSSATSSFTLLPLVGTTDSGGNAAVSGVVFAEVPAMAPAVSVLVGASSGGVAPTILPQVRHVRVGYSQ